MAQQVRLRWCGHASIAHNGSRSAGALLLVMGEQPRRG
jgi:hypothetical protein